MFERLKSYLVFGNQFCGVEHTTKAGKDILYAILLKKKKSAVETAQTYEQNSIAELVKLLPKKQHLTLLINNDKVIL